MTHPTDTSEELRALLPELPRPACTFADHSYPAFSKAQMEAYALAAMSRARSTTGAVEAHAQTTRPQMGDYVLLETLRWWRQLVDLNPQDLAPRLDAAIERASLPQPTAQSTGEVSDKKPKYTAAPQDPMDMLAEEGLEVAHERMKAIRFGWDGTLEWAQMGNQTPRLRFIQEVADFQVALKHALHQKKILPEELAAAEEKKHARLEELFGMKRPDEGASTPAQSGMVAKAAKIASDWAEKFQAEADKPDQTKVGKEIRDCQVIAALRIADDIRALSHAPSQPAPVNAGLVELLADCYCALHEQYHESQPAHDMAPEPADEWSYNIVPLFVAIQRETGLNHDELLASQTPQSSGSAG